MGSDVLRVDGPPDLTINANPISTYTTVRHPSVRDGVIDALLCHSPRDGAHFGPGHVLATLQWRQLRLDSHL